MVRFTLLFLSILSVLPAANFTDEAWQTLILGVKDGNANRRKEALAALVVAGPNPRAVSMAESLLLDKEVDVRQIAASVLGDMNSRKAIPKLTKALGDDAPEVSFTAARSLWNLGDKRGKNIFLAVLAGDRGNSAGLLKESMRSAKMKLRDPASLAMLGIKEGAGAFLGPAALGITVFEELRKDGSASARTLAASMLATDNDPKTIASLEDALIDKNWVVRAAVVKALVMRRSKASVPKIHLLLQDKREAVRYVAAAAMIRLKGETRKPSKPKPDSPISFVERLNPQ